MKLQFLGANRQVTGSRYFLEAGGLRILIDCGMFQERPFLERNWASLPIDPAKIDVFLLTHAHLDHSGLIPRLVAQGLKAPILTTAASIDLTRIVLMDSAKIQEEDAAFKVARHERERRKPPRPVAPLYTVGDAQRAMNLFKPVNYRETVTLNDNVSVRYLDAGHILGSASLEITIREGAGQKRLLFSGDIGQWDKPLIQDPTLFSQADYVVMESTYGDRNHENHGSIDTQLADVVNQTAKAGGHLLIPTFAIERAQEILFYFNRLVRDKRIPVLPVFVDSPMAVDATQVMLNHPECLDEQMLELLRSNESPFRFPGLRMTRSVDESKAINKQHGPCVIMAGSGMCNAGRIKHHLANDISRPATTVLFVGYQGEGTLGREILSGKSEVRIHGEMRPVKARVAEISGFSAHADQAALLRWVGALQSPPRQMFLTHGEESAALTLAELLKKQHGWPVTVPTYGQVVELS
jgi:metallo-beta-lactamase family protein